MRYASLLAVLLLGLTMAACDGGTGGGGTRQVALVPVGEPRVVNDPNLFRVDGRVQNTSSDQTYTGIVTATLFDADGKIVGVFQGAVNSVAPGEEATYTAIGTDKPAEGAWARVEVRVSTQIPG